MAENKQGRTPQREGGRGPRISEKPKDFKKSIGQLFRFMQGSYAWLVIAVVLVIIGNVLTLIAPSIIGRLAEIVSEAVPTVLNGVPVDNLGKTVDVKEITNIVITVAAFLVALYFSSFMQGFIMSSVTQKISKKMRSRISHKINSLPLSFIDRISNGDVLSVITNDVDTIGQSLSESFTTFISSVIQIVGVLVLMFITNYILALCAVASSLLGFLIVSVVLKKSQRFFRAQQQQLGLVNGHIEEIYGAHTTILISNAQREEKQEFDALNNKLYKSAWKAQFLGGLMGPIMGFIGNLGYVVVCVVGSLLAVNGVIAGGFGTIVAFILYVRLFSSPLSQLGQVTASIQTAAAASERVFKFLDEPDLVSEKDKKNNRCAEDGSVVFKNVNFSYTPDKPIIKDFSVEIKPGQKVAIVGKTGAGKTTLVNLLMRFYEVDSGDIIIGGVNAKELTRDYIHSLFGMVLQDTWIFNGTVRENIIFNQKNVTDEQVKDACKACGLHHLIMTLPHGYDTILSETSTLSAGQKQLLTIARAMVQNAPMLILDEATSSVDTRTELLIGQSMDKLTTGRTSFVIAHRLSTIKDADVILVVEDGNIVEQGTHEELLSNKNGVYARLYNSQFE